MLLSCQTDLATERKKSITDDDEPSRNTYSWINNGVQTNVCAFPLSSDIIVD